MKTSTLILTSLGVVAAGAVAYVALKKPARPDDENPATKNPWRGTGSSCEVDFDSKAPAEKAKIVALLAAVPRGTPGAAALYACDPEAYRNVLGKIVPAPTLPAANHPDDLNPATKNPWRGTSLPCESEFDGMSLPQKQATVALLAAAKAQSEASYKSLLKCEKARPFVVSLPSQPIS